MVIKYFSELKLLTHLSEGEKAQLKEILGANFVGSEMSFSFYYTLGYDDRLLLYGYASGLFSDRIMAESNLGDTWAALSISVNQSEMDQPLLEQELEVKFKECLLGTFGPRIQLLKVSPIKFDR